MVARVLGSILTLALLALSACGGSGSDSTSTDGSNATTPGNADPADVEVIDGWVTALRHGDVDAAAEYFAIPSVAENGPILVRIRSIEDARRFNESLPCGARLIRADSTGEFTTATFRLTERKGASVSCGSGVGNRARTLFLLRDGKIVHWIRATDPPDAADGTTS